MSLNRSIRERLLTRVEPAGDCWIWAGSRTQGGYGKLTINYRSRLAHRVSYEAFRGAIPDGLEVDHLCRKRACINPSHLEAVTHSINQRRGGSPIGINAAKTKCNAGHRLSGGNLYVTPDGRRQCRACRADASRRSYANCQS